MEGLLQIATAYYERSSDNEKEEVENFFRKLDVNGDGKVSLQELKNSSVGSWISNENVYRQLDVNGDGSLDFYEVLAVYYMVNKVDLLVCSGCFGLLVGSYFSCSMCLGKGSDTFDLCCDCYRCGHVEHQHPSDCLMDHHSLLSLFRKRTTDAEQRSQPKREMEELREIARAHYRAGSPKVQAIAYDFYQAMDTDGDGKVDLSEFLAFMRQHGYTHMRNHQFFCDLDLDNNGTLDFSEVMTLYYIIKSGRPFCDECGKFIPGTFFSCVECYKNPKSAFNLCPGCYQSAKCNHNHAGRTQFLDNYTLLEATRDSSLAKDTGVSSAQRSPLLPSNAIVTVPVQGHHHHQANIYCSPSYPAYHTYAPHTPTAPPPTYYQNAIVPAADVAPVPSNWEKWRLALQTLEVALGIGTIAATQCAIL